MLWACYSTLFLTKFRQLFVLFACRKMVEFVEHASDVIRRADNSSHKVLNFIYQAQIVCFKTEKDGTELLMLDQFYH